MEANMMVRAGCCLVVALGFPGLAFSEEPKTQERAPRSGFSEVPKTQEREAYVCLEKDSVGFSEGDKKGGVARFIPEGFTMVIEGKIMTVKARGKDHTYECRPSSINTLVLQCE